ncbi:hypothetical protein [Micromonospora sp. C95]|uniref:hypothetical protein n=1 Tax=Micromonospora sp. C95 TaxID=2824882 RepID=UPI00265746CE|nr:hypothetical protein [Micromonospora sp. C95]
MDTRQVAVEYRIAPLGKMLPQLIDALLGWSETHLPEVQRAQTLRRAVAQRRVALRD